MTNPIDAALRRARSALGIVALFSACLNLLALVLPIYMLLVFDKVLSSYSIPTLILISLIAALGTGIGSILDGARGFILIKIASWFDRYLGPIIFATSVDNAVKTRNAFAEELRSLGVIRQFLASPTVGTVFDTPWVVIYVAVVFLLHPLLGGLISFGGLILLGVAVLNDRLTAKQTAAATKLTQSAAHEAQTTLRNADTVIAMGLGDVCTRRWSDVNDSARASSESVDGLNLLLLAIFRFLRIALQIGLIALAAWLILEEELSVGAMTAITLLSSRALVPVEQALTTWKQSRQAYDAYGSLRRFLGSQITNSTAVALPQHEGFLTVDNIHFGFGRGTPLIRGISFGIRPGRMLVIMGPSASGKSTIARLATGILAPQLGSIRLDGAEVHSYPRQEFGQFVGFLPQSVDLFDATVAANIARLQDYEMEDVVSAAKIAGVHEMILKLPDGYGTVIGERGAPLSGGQRQRIGLARAVYAKPRLLVLDEPNSNLDPDGDSALNDCLSQMKASGTACLIISHRPAVLAPADDVLVLRNGVIDLYGPKERVLMEFEKRAKSTVAPVRMERPIAVS